MNGAKRIKKDTAHALPADLKREIIKNSEAWAAWEDITPIARNEWVCWVESAKKPETRARRVRRVREELAEGMRRPCCWAGCQHRGRK